MMSLIDGSCLLLPDTGKYHRLRSGDARADMRQHVPQAMNAVAVEEISSY